MACHTCNADTYVYICDLAFSIHLPPCIYDNKFFPFNTYFFLPNVFTVQFGAITLVIAEITYVQ